MNINLNTGEGVDIRKFPDGQPHVILKEPCEGRFSVTCSITSSDKMIELLEVANAIDNCFGKKADLHIPYLMGARYDRSMVPGDSVDLKVFAKLINSMEFEKVWLYDVHSTVALQLIDRSVNVENYRIVRSYNKPESVLICPDAGAAKKIDNYIKWNDLIKDVVYCDKKRDLTNGNITLEVRNKEVCSDRNCLIIDDLCDGGWTFIKIAEQIKPKFLTLMVTHGIFSQGFENLEKHFDEIVVANTYKSKYDSDIVKIIRLV